MAFHNGALQVRTLNDKTHEEHERHLMASILCDNVNPFEYAAEAILNPMANVYRNYLYSSGVMFVAFAFWTAYPSFVRYRHKHIMRYRRNQLTLRRWVFLTPHLPKWDKKYLQRIVIPPPPAATTSVEDIVNRGKRNLRESTGSMEGTTTEVIPQPEGAVDLSIESTASSTKSLYCQKTIRTSASSQATFANNYEAQSERDIKKELAVISRAFYENSFDTPLDVSMARDSVYSRILDAVRRGKARVVLKEDSTTVQSIPPAWCVWWVSAQEEQRRHFCVFWLIALAVARALQDLLYMPEMPAFVS